ncbi:transcription factor WhiB [Aeromicrobium sp. SMF47]|uniref:Transcription factor WhiB n=1 Tax=Aeromicrobium yanjiei TaxID=2662028 RepID=A0A5Q2MI78_9ACTN|nr:MULTISPECIES: WhiB family transcriptional regulator [Aeromicrobium]MRJ75576.1 transcription factor WhiB [Aeromicrobium yanjiei]MRJ99919.1 transcription factor WhiB [Aeromicrobium sp. S22]QGG40005.1 transcription factor WhiB [Aeromicrobium yanjiei]
MTILAEPTAPPCASVPDIYHDEQLHSPPARTDVTAAEWDRLAAKRASAHRQCAACPLMVECLYRAVVEVDVSGFVACTTEHDRHLIRRQLGIQVQQASTTPYGAPRVGGGPVSHDAVMTARQAYPKDTCHQLADRLGCSTSTIKRHLRRAREQQLEAAAAPREPVALLPSTDAVLDAFDQLSTSRVA